MKRYIQQVGGSEGVMVERDGRTLSYEDVAVPAEDTKG